MNKSYLQCPQCDTNYKALPPKHRCSDCGSALEYQYDYEALKSLVSLEGSINFWRYASFLPEVKVEHRISLGEGGTPIIPAKRLSKKIGLTGLSLKDETRNPTNSFRDRAATLMVSNSFEYGYKHLVCASNGNLGASVAAYAAKAGLECSVIVPRRVHVGKLAQMYAYNAQITTSGDIVDDSIEMAEKLAREEGFYQATDGLNPLTIESQKTMAFEIWEQTDVPDWIIAPMGSGGTVYSLWKGFRELEVLDLSNKMPRIVGVQAEGCAPIVEAFEGEGGIKSPRKAETDALAILVKRPLIGEQALKAIRESDGFAISVSDESIRKAEGLLAQSEGLFSELASAATISCVQKLVTDGAIDSTDKVVCLITASGLKAPYVLEALIRHPKVVGVRGKVSVKLRILRLLELGKSYGYLIWNSLGRSISLQAVYQHLTELEDKDLISSKEEGKRKYYQIMGRGKRVLDALEELAALF
ncbi:MAG: threonine synthase [Promethearchaeota archaeon]